jgi:hypothetical protein
VIEQVSLCQTCHQRSEAGEFKAGRGLMIDGLEKTGGHTAAAPVTTDYTYFACRDCGEKWMMTEDTSAGGPARYLSRRRS